MKRKVLITLLALLVTLFACNLTACGIFGGSGPTVGLSYTLSDDKTYYVCSGIGSAKGDNIVIGSTYNDLPVKGIKEYAFAHNNTFKNITISDSIEFIGKYAFFGCYGLESIEIPSSVTSIGYGAFYSFSNLKYNEYENGLYLGNSENKYVVLVEAKDTTITSFEINSNTKFIYSNAFEGCSGLESIEIPSSVTSIGDYAFYACRSLENIEIPSSVTSIGFEAFNICDSLRYNEYENGLYLGNSENKYVLLVKAKDKSITNCEINFNTKFIYDYAFYACRSLESIEIPSSVTSIGYNVFTNCDSLRYNEYENGLYLGNCENKYALLVKAKDKSITNCEINFNTKFIYDYAFYDCSNLKTVTFGENSKLASIGEYAFYGCSDLESIEIPSGVTSIGEYAFYDCSSLESITFTGAKEQWNAISKGSCWNDGAGSYIIYCTDGDIAKS